MPREVNKEERVEFTTLVRLNGFFYFAIKLSFDIEIKLAKSGVENITTTRNRK